MKKYFALPLAALFVVACSEPTANSNNNEDLAVAYAKPVPPTPPSGCTTCNIANTTFTFEDGSVIAAGGATIGTAPAAGAVTASDANVVQAPENGPKFLGRFSDVHTMVVINVPSGASRYNLDFDFYVIGSWDGRGKQAQHGVFDANVLEIGYSCVGSTATGSLFKTTFSNQLTVQQDYPLAYLTGGNKAGTNAKFIDALKYADHPELSHTPVFRSFGDAIYGFSFAGPNPCGTNGIQFQISTTNPLQQSAYDESWGVDNITVKAGS